MKPFVLQSDIFVIFTSYVVLYVGFKFSRLRRTTNLIFLFMVVDTFNNACAIFGPFGESSMR